MLYKQNDTTPFSGMIMEAGKGVAVSNILGDMLNAIVGHFANARRKRQCAKLHQYTKIEITKLSTQIQHDIGWPARYESQKCVEKN